MCCCTLTKKRRTSLSVLKTSDVLPSTGMKRPRMMTSTGHYQTCVHVCGIVCYHDATQCFASEIQFVYCYSETIIQCAILMFASTFLELYITMLQMSALHRRVKLSIVTLIFYSIAALSRWASTCVLRWSSLSRIRGAIPYHLSLFSNDCKDSLGAAGRWPSRRKYKVVPEHCSSGRHCRRI